VRESPRSLRPRRRVRPRWWAPLVRRLAKCGDVLAQQEAGHGHIAHGDRLRQISGIHVRVRKHLAEKRAHLPGDHRVELRVDTSCRVRDPGEHVRAEHPLLIERPSRREHLTCAEIHQLRGHGGGAHVHHGPDGPSLPLDPACLGWLHRHLARMGRREYARLRESLVKQDRHVARDPRTAGEALAHRDGRFAEQFALVAAQRCEPAARADPARAAPPRPRARSVDLHAGCTRSLKQRGTHRDGDRAVPRLEAYGRAPGHWPSDRLDGTANGWRAGTRLTTFPRARMPRRLRRPTSSPQLLRL